MSYGKYEYCGYCRYCICDEAREQIMNGKFKCDRERTWVFANARPLKSNCFWQRPSYQLSDCDEAIALSKKYQGFYITTTIFRMLGLGINSDLNTLYAFRQNYLDSSQSARGFMHDYDILGPKIAKMLELSDKNHSFAQALYDFYILGTLKLINAGNLDGASELYEAMYARLREKFITGPLKLQDRQISYMSESAIRY